MADRQFCDLDQPVRFAKEGDHYLIRRSKSNGFHPDPAQSAGTRTDAQGPTHTSEWGWLGAIKQGPRRR